jgi:5-formyltetrahydrofolate cyclo-ligase
VNKQELRGEIKRHLSRLPPVSFHDEGLRAVHILQNQPSWNQYSTVLIFLSMNNEIDTMPLLRAALNNRKKLFVPRVEGEKIQFYRILSADGPWQKGPFGIREPLLSGNNEMDRLLTGADFPALVITPGLAFTKQGKRLGYGGGFYDRFFADSDKAGLPYTAMGLCMVEQLVDDLPTDSWDRKMDGVLTGNDLCYFSRF